MLKNNKRDQRVEDVEAKFKYISDAIEHVYGEHATAIVYTPDGVIMRGSPLELALTYKRCDAEALKQLKELKDDMLEEAIAQVSHMEKDDDGVIVLCNNPNCPKHGKK